MEEITKEEFENSETICKECVGEYIRIQLPPEKSLFTIKHFIKWCYQCNVCGKKSKEYKTKK